MKNYEKHDVVGDGTEGGSFVGAGQSLVAFAQADVEFAGQEPDFQLDVPRPVRSRSRQIRTHRRRDVRQGLFRSSRRHRLRVDRT